jgi:hypothetical protein
LPINRLAILKAFGVKCRASSFQRCGNDQRVVDVVPVLLRNLECCLVHFNQQLKPILALINDKYHNRIRFLRFDITSEETSARAKEQAQKLGFADFFEKNHDRTSLVVILDSSGREVFRTINDYDPQHYEAVLDQQLLPPAK